MDVSFDHTADFSMIFRCSSEIRVILSSLHYIYILFRSDWKTYTGWWLSHRSEKDKSQLGWSETQYMEESSKCSKAPLDLNYIFLASGNVQTSRNSRILEINPIPRSY